MEDQSADSGDLTTTTPEEAATASVPQGKAARSRHRLPRQRARQLDDTEQTDGPDADGAAPDEPTDLTPPTAAVEESSPTDGAAATDVTSETEVPPETEVSSETKTVAETETETKAVEPHSEPEPTTASPEQSRRRLPWRRAKAADTATADHVTAETVTNETVDDGTEVDDETAEAETATDDATASPRVSLVKAAGDTAADGATEPEPEPVLVPHRPAGRLLKAVAVAAGVLFVVAGAVAGAALQPYLADRAAVQEKFEIAQTAASAITTLWTYTPDDMDRLADRSAKFLSNDFATEYRNYIDGIAATNKQAQVTNSTQVLGAAVESLSSNDATALVYTNSVATSPLTKGIPSLRYFSYRLSMVRDGSRWLVTQMVAVTKLDLTPRL